MKYANIKPITAIFNKPKANVLIVTSQGDNLYSEAQFNYTLLSKDTEGNMVSLIEDSLKITNGEYESWGKDGEAINEFPYVFVAEQLGLEIIDMVIEEPIVPVE
jgi:hypothetical protein